MRGKHNYATFVRVAESYAQLVGERGERGETVLPALDSVGSSSGLTFFDAACSASISAAPTKLSLHTPACRSSLALEIGSFPKESSIGLAAANRPVAPAPASGAPAASLARPRLADEGRSDSDDAPSPSRAATRRLASADDGETPAELPSSLPIQIRSGRPF